MPGLLPKLLALAVLVAPLQVSAQVDISQAVIEQCNAATSASNLPDCLKTGAVAWEMIRLAQTGDYYAEAATPVLDICSANNDTFATAWVCFENAAEKAVETRELVGIANITDQCVSGISDPGILARLSAADQELRSTRFPDGNFSSFMMYSPFQGCPAEQKETAAAGPMGSAPVIGPESLDQDACSAYAEIGRIIADSTPDELRAIGARMNTMETKDKDVFADATGLSAESITYLMGQDQKRAITTSMFVGGFLKKHHPKLLDEAMSDMADQSEDPATQFGSELGMAFVEQLLDTALENYEKDCGPS